MATFVDVPNMFSEKIKCNLLFNIHVQSEGKMLSKRDDYEIS